MPTSTAAEPLIVALDTASVQESRRMVSELNKEVRSFKIGLRHCSESGLRFARELAVENYSVFLDLKLFDIPATIEQATANLIRAYAPTFLTVHGDPGVVAAAVAGRGDADTRLLAITVLTSVDRSQLDDMMMPDGSVSEVVTERARRALAAGADGIVASPLEVTALRALPECTGKLLVVPGIRLGQAIGNDDQRRIATPSEAMRAGADHLVVGRPILNADDPVGAVRRILEDIKQA